jgi:D-allose transport system ATP-binding protein
MRVRAAMMLLRVGLKIDLDEKVANLSISHKQMLEIAKTLMLDAKVLIMDEPTSSLTNKEVDYLFLIMNQLRKEGTAIVYISHKLAEIRRICDRYTVMKDGSSVCSGMVSEVNNDDIVRLMVGRELQNRFNAMKESTGNIARETVFEVKNVTSHDKKKVRDISFSVNRGEILGFAGLVGSGRTELMDCLFGVDKRSGGEIYLNGKAISPLAAGRLKKRDGLHHRKPPGKRLFPQFFHRSEHGGQPEPEARRLQRGHGAVPRRRRTQNGGRAAQAAGAEVPFGRSEHHRAFRRQPAEGADFQMAVLQPRSDHF